MKRLTLQDLSPIIGEEAAQKLLSTHPAIFSTLPEGETYQSVSFTALQPWRGETLTVHLPTGTVTLAIPEELKAQAIDAVIQAEIQELTLGLRVEGLTITEIWVNQ